MTVNNEYDKNQSVNCVKKMISCDWASVIKQKANARQQFQAHTLAFITKNPP